jgi:ribosomal protein S18 acetylase RimI-like enzyme
MPGVLRLRDADPADDTALIGWFPDAEALGNWAGHGPSWPLDRAQLDRRRADPDVRAWTAFLDRRPGEPVGHVELIHLGPGAARLDRVVIAPALRGRGLGAELVAAALAEARAAGARTVDLLVYAANLPAIRAYAGAGFTDRGPISADYPDVRRMQLDLAR